MRQKSVFLPPVTQNEIHSLFSTTSNLSISSYPQNDSSQRKRTNQTLSHLIHPSINTFFKISYLFSTLTDTSKNPLKIAFGDGIFACLSRDFQPFWLKTSRGILPAEQLQNIFIISY